MEPTALPLSEQAPPRPVRGSVPRPFFLLTAAAALRRSVAFGGAAAVIPLDPTFTVFGRQPTSPSP